MYVFVLDDTDKRQIKYEKQKQKNSLCFLKNLLLRIKSFNVIFIADINILKNSLKIYKNLVTNKIYKNCNSLEEGPRLFLIWG